MADKLTYLNGLLEATEARVTAKAVKTERKAAEIKNAISEAVEAGDLSVELPCEHLEVDYPLLFSELKSLGYEVVYLISNNTYSNGATVIRWGGDEDGWRSSKRNPLDLHSDEDEEDFELPEELSFLH